MKRMPVQFVGEFRGVKAASSFVRKGTGEVVNVGATLKFEYVDGSGEPNMYPVGAAGFDKLAGGFDWGALKVGDLVHVEGVQVSPDRGETDGGYFTLTHAVVVPAGSRLGVVDGKGATLKAA